MSTISDRDTSLWWLAAPPAIWALHFLLSYATAAVWCAKHAGPGGAAGGAQLAIGAYTLVALAGVTLVGVRGLRHHRHGDSPPPHDADTREDRHRFLGYAGALLAGLSTIAILYELAAVLLIESCL
jgi:hypothetical protein